MLKETLPGSVPVQVVGGNPSANGADAPVAIGAAAQTVATPPRKGKATPIKTTTASPDPPASDPLATGDDLAGPVDPAEDEGDALGLAQPTLSPAEAHARGLVLTRALFNANQRGPVKTIQKQMGVAKFTDIPISDGPKLYALAKAEADKAGINA